MSESGTPAFPATDRSQSDIQCPARPSFALSISDCRKAHGKDPARRLSSTLSTVNHEAEQYLKNERQGVTIRPTCCERLKQWATTVVDVRIPSIPILHWLPKYNFRRQLVDDLNAGLACAITLIPQGMAYGAQLGVPVIHGLYSAIFFGLVYAFMGTSRETCPGNSALVTLMAASAIDVGSPVLSGSESRLIAVLHFTFLVGFLQLGLGIFRMGAIVHYVSEPVLTACSSVGIVITVISQLKYMLGINVPSFRYTFQTLRYITFHLSSTNPWELLIGIPVLVLVSGVAAWKKRPPTGTSWDRFGRRLAIALPLLVVLYTTILAYHLYERHHLPIKLVGRLPTGFQTFPAWELRQGDLSRYATSGLTVAVVSFLLSYSCQKSYAHKGRYEVGVDQELSALGLSNMVGSCFGGFVAVSSYARASVNYEAGGRTQMSALVASTLVIVVVQWLSPAFYYVPMSGLAALLCGALVSSFTVQPFFETYQSSPRDFFVLVASSIVMFVVSVDTGIYSGIGLSICNLLLQYSYPDLEELGRLSGAPGKWRAVKRYRHAVTPRNIRVLRLDEALTFVNGDFVTGLLLRAAKTMEAEAKGLNGPEASMPHVVKTAPHMTSLTVVCACKHVRGHGNTTRDWMPGCQETLGSEGVQRGSAGWTSPTATTIKEMESPRVALPDDNRTDSLASRCLPFQRKRKDGERREAKKCCHLFIVLDASGINFMDFSGLRALGKVAQNMRDHGVRLLIAQAKSRLQDMLQTAPTLYHDVGGDKIKLSLEDLVYLLERHEMRLHRSLFASTREDGNKPQKVAAGC